MKIVLPSEVCARVKAADWKDPMSFLDKARERGSMDPNDPECVLSSNEMKAEERPEVLYFARSVSHGLLQIMGKESRGCPMIFFGAVAVALTAAFMVGVEHATQELRGAANTEEESPPDQA